MMAVVGAVLLGITMIGIAWPVVLAVPVVILAGWIGIALIVRACGLYLRPNAEAAPAPSRRSDHSD